MALQLFEQSFTERDLGFSLRPLRHIAGIGITRTRASCYRWRTLRQSSAILIQADQPVVDRPSVTLYSMNDFRATLPHYVCILHPLQHRQCYSDPFSLIRSNMDDYKRCVMYLLQLLFRGVLIKWFNDTANQGPILATPTNYVCNLIRSQSLSRFWYWLWKGKFNQPTLLRLPRVISIQKLCISRIISVFRSIILTSTFRKHYRITSHFNRVKSNLILSYSSEGSSLYMSF